MKPPLPRESQHINMQSYLPNNIQPSTFVMFIYDNCDHNPESITGVSMHCTNGIIVKRQSPESEFLTTNATAIVTSNRRSFKPVTHELAPYYQSRDNVTLPPIDNIEMNENMLGDMMSKVSNFVWLMSRLYASLNGEEQGVPSWTGFYHEVVQTNCDKPHSVYFLPAINQSPTRYDTVQEVSAIGSIRICIVNQNQQKPKAWTKYLQNPDNKIELVEFASSVIGHKI